MSISHIPRSVGHNYTPEYQISAIPYYVDLQGTNYVETLKYVKRKSDDRIVGETTLAAEPGDAVKTFNIVPDSNIFTNHSVKKVQGLNTNDFEVIDTAIKVVKLPKISRWIKFFPKAPHNDGIKFNFSRHHILNNRFFEINYEGINPSTNSNQQQFIASEPFEIRCTNIYFDDDGLQGKLLVGLTTIDRTEFEEVVEQFLEKEFLTS